MENQAKPWAFVILMLMCTLAPVQTLVIMNVSTQLISKLAIQICIEVVVESNWYCVMTYISLEGGGGRGEGKGGSLLILWWY